MTSTPPHEDVERELIRELHRRALDIENAPHYRTAPAGRPWARVGALSWFLRPRPQLTVVAASLAVLLVAASVALLARWHRPVLWPRTAAGRPPRS
jgi:hypothetical protein